MQRHIIIVILLLMLSISNGLGQSSKIDSLFTELKNARHDTTEIKTNIELGVAYTRNKPDSAIIFLQRSIELIEKSHKQAHKDFYTNKKARTLYCMGIVYYFQAKYKESEESLLKAMELYQSLNYDPELSDCYNSIGNVHQATGNYQQALDYFNKSLEVRIKLDDKKRIGSCYNNMGIVYRLQGLYDLAIENYKKNLEINQELDDKSGIAMSYNNLGIIYRLQGSFPEAIEYHTKSLTIKEELGDKRGMALSYNNIGGIHQEQFSYDLAYDYYIKSMEISEELGDKRGLAMSYTNIGNVARLQGKFELAYEYFQKTIKIREEIGDKYGLSISYNSMGLLHQEQKNFDLAVEFHLKSLKIKEEIGDKNGIVHTLGNLSAISNEIANTSKDTKSKIYYHKKAIEYAYQALDIAKEMNALALKKMQYQNLHLAYNGLGNYNKAYNYSLLYIQINDSLFSEEKTKVIAEIQTKYETEKHQQEIANQKLIIERQEVESKRQQTQKLFLYTVVFLLFILLTVILFAYRQKRRSNQTTKLKNVLLEQANEEIKAQKDEITAQRDMVISHKRLLEQQKEKITNSINYARVIQTAVLPSNEDSDKLLGEHFILFKPKEIVSGDFFWVSHVKGLTVFAVADCTGHGVPGAFMSMLGISFLKEIIGKKGITKPSEILDNLRDSIIEALQQKGSFGDQNEGINMSLCILDRSNNQLLFSGAKNPVFIVTANKDFTTLQPDKQPIAIYRKMEPFANQQIALNKGDSIYLATDGFQDQFGGEHQKRFTAKRFKELLIEISDKPMTNQKGLLEQAFEDWKGYNEQIDDVTIMGVKL
ncbi:MAG: tetratricopeptide repeat protein [Bacteroidetes bacterium]|nr:tetratricopeptide repeat protein [Bacteroidota bacterium]